MQNDEQNQGSEGRDRARDFFYHLVVFLFVIAILYVAGTGGALVWIALGWGFAVALHGVYAFFG